MALFSYIISRIRDRCVFLLLFIIVLNIKKNVKNWENIDPFIFICLKI